MTNIDGVRTTNNIASAKIMVDMADKIALLQASKNPFLTFLKNIKKDPRVAYAPKVEWLEDDLLGIYTTASAEALAAATTVKVVDGSIIRAYDILKVPSTGECLLVTAVSANDLTVVRGYGSTSAATIAASAEVLVIGNAQEENAGARAIKSTQESGKYNYTQIFKTPVGVSGTEAATKMYGGKDLKYQRKKAGIEHAREIAMAMYFGQKKLDTTNTNTVRRTMGGVVEFLTSGSQTQAFAANGTHLNYNTFDTLIAQEAFSYGSGEKLLVAGPALSAQINSWALNKVVTDVKGETYGMQVKNLITSYGDMKVIYDPLLKVSTTYAGYGFVLDMDYINYVYLDGRDTKLRVDIQDADIDGIKDEYLTECSLEFKNPECHILLTGCYNPGTTES